ncbi:MAG TPA: DUF5343 domain-containing protein [Bryobacteraceae bacterium]|nr:DUF5343 domain-containing protein [Bryobacteraceae bacterium]
MGAETLSNVAAYAPFKTFLNSLEGLRGVVPSHINRTVWPSFSGGTVSQLITTYRFLGLIDEDGKPTRHLSLLASDNVPARQSELRQLLQRSYPEVIAINLVNATPKQLTDAFLEQYSVSGATLQKAISFFLNAAQYAELPLSQFLTRRRGRRKRGAQNKSRSGNTLDKAEMPQDSQQGTTRTIQLSSGGEIALRVQFDAFTISQTDRDFIFGLIDELGEYEREAATSAGFSRQIAHAIQQSRESVTDDDVPF